jgi:hypothetical protein
VKSLGEGSPGCESWDFFTPSSGNQGGYVKINPHIFREYDIRGVVDKDLTPAVVRTLGEGFGTHMANSGRKELVIGRDGRLSSKSFSEVLIEGLTSTGCNVVDIGRWDDGYGESQSAGFQRVQGF